MESKYYKATDVMAMLECSETYAYKVIRQLNEELEADGHSSTGQGAEAVP